MIITNKEILRLYNLFLPITSEHFSPLVKYKIALTFTSLNAIYNGIAGVLQESVEYYQNEAKLSYAEQELALQDFYNFLHEVDIQSIKIDEISPNLSVKTMQGLFLLIELKEEEALMKLTKREIYNYFLQLQAAFSNGEQMLPARLNYKIQKNIFLLQSLAENIEAQRSKIIIEYGVKDERDNTYSVPIEQQDMVSQLLNELFEQTESVRLNEIAEEELDGEVELTTAQMAAILFMIKDNQTAGE